MASLSFKSSSIKRKFKKYSEMGTSNAPLQSWVTYVTSVSDVNNLGRPAEYDSFGNWIGYESPESSCIYVNSDDTVIYGINFYTGDYGYPLYGVLTKLGKDGAPVWQRKISSPATLDTDKVAQIKAVSGDSSGNVYVVGYYSTSAGFYGFLAKYNSSGSLQWQRQLTSATAGAVTVDTSGNIFVVGGYYNTTGYFFYAKYNSSGTLQWQRTIVDANAGSSAYILSFKYAGLDSSGNLYAAHSDGIVKYNTSGTLQWRRRPSTSVVAAVVDASGNFYFTTQSTVYSQTLVKYNTAGTLQWQRAATSAMNVVGLRMAASDSQVETLVYSGGAKIVYSSAGSIVGSVWTGLGLPYVYTPDSTSQYLIGGAGGGYVAKIKSNLSQAGSYTFNPYIEVTIGPPGNTYTVSDTAGTTTFTTPTETEAAGGMTDAAGAVVDAAGNLFVVNFGIA